MRTPYHLYPTNSFINCPPPPLFFQFYFYTDEEHARAQEEQWIDALGTGSTGAGSGSPDSDSRARAVLNGIVIGFFFPLLPFFFFRGSKPAAFFETGHAIEATESTVFSYAFYQSHLCYVQTKADTDVV